MDEDTAKPKRVQAGVSWEEGDKLDYITLAKAGGRRGKLAI